MADWQIRNPDWTPDAVIAQFSGEGPQAELYRMLEALDRDAFLNSGYSRKGQRHWSRKSQIRLADRLGSRLFRRGPRPIRLLDVGCGRGGPAFRARARWEADVQGLDVCSYNIDRAIARTRRDGVHEGLYFRAGNALNLPYEDGAYPYVWCIESAEYVENKRSLFEGIARVLMPGGRLAMAAVAIDEDVAGNSRFALDAIARFLRAWGMPYLETLGGYQDHIEAAGLRVTRREDATARTLERHLPKLERVMKILANPILRRTTAWYVRRKTDTDVTLMREQIEATAEALQLGVLRYGLYWAEKPAES